MKIILVLTSGLRVGLTFCAIFGASRAAAMTPVIADPALPAVAAFLAQPAWPDAEALAGVAAAGRGRTGGLVAMDPYVAFEWISRNDFGGAFVVHPDSGQTGFVTVLIHMVRIAPTRQRFWQILTGSTELGSAPRSENVTLSSLRERWQTALSEGSIPQARLVVGQVFTAPARDQRFADGVRRLSRFVQSPSFAGTFLGSDEAYARVRAAVQAGRVRAVTLDPRSPGRLQMLRVMFEDDGLRATAVDIGHWFGLIAEEVRLLPYDGIRQVRDALRALDPAPDALVHWTDWTVATKPRRRLNLAGDLAANASVTEQPSYAVAAFKAFLENLMIAAATRAVEGCEARMTGADRTLTAPDRTVAVPEP